MSRKVFLYMLFMLMSVQVFAQAEWRVSNDESRVSNTDSTNETSYQPGIGGVNILDTYLSPLEYTGTEVRFISTVEKHKGFWTNQFQHEAYFSTVENKHKTASEPGAMYRFRYGRMHDINIKVDGLTRQPSSPHHRCDTALRWTSSS